MSSALFDVQVDTSEVRGVLRDMAEARRLAEVFAVIAEDLVAAVVDRIDSRGDGEWDPLAEATIARKGSDAPLIDKGQLRSSIRAESSSEHAQASTSVGHIVYHLDGGEVIPKRNPFEVRDEIFEQAALLIAQAVAEA